MLQIFWMRDHGIANAIPDGERNTHLGSYLSPDAAEAGLNFLTSDIHLLALREMLLREEDALYDEDRLVSNSLGSQGVTFNALGPLALDLKLATKVFRQLLPTFVHTVDRVAFETSPGRRDARLTADRSSFDSALYITTPQGEPGVVYIEVKYSEDMTGPAARWRERYDQALHEVRLFKDPNSPILRTAPLEQLMREHCLAALSVQAGIVPRAVFVALAPRLNRRCSAAFKVYANELLPIDETDPTCVPFRHFTLEAFIDAINVAGDQSTADRLWQRYCNFQRVYDAALHVLAPKLGANATASSSSGRPADTRASAARKRLPQPDASGPAGPTEASANAS